MAGDADILLAPDIECGNAVHKPITAFTQMKNAALCLGARIPVIAELTKAMGINPALMSVPLAYTASCVFLLPIDPIPLTTYKYGHWRMVDMMKPGLVISIVWVFLLTGFMYCANILGIF